MSGFFKGSPKSAGDVDVKSLHDMNVDSVDNSIVSTTNEDLGRQKPWSVTSAIKFAAEKEATTGYESESDTGSECSFNTTVTDHTFNLNNLRDVEESDRDSCSASISQTSALHSELRDIRDCTPFREMASYSICEADVSSSASPGLSCISLMLFLMLCSSLGINFAFHGCFKIKILLFH